MRPLSWKRARSAACSLAALLSGLALPGCVTKSIERVAAPLRPPRVATLHEVLSAYDAYCAGLETLSASGDLDVKDLRAGKQRRLSARVLAARGSRLYIKGTAVLVTALEVVSNGDRFWFQVPSKKTVWTGLSEATAAVEGAANEPYYALRPRDVNAGLLPEPLLPGAGDVLSLEGDASSFCLTLSAVAGARGEATVRRRVCLERETLRPSGIKNYDENGNLTADMSLADVQEGVAHRVVISRPAEGYVAVFAFDKVVTNQPVPERAFAPRTPEGYAVVEVGK